MTTSNNAGLWTESYGAIGATLKALQDAGATTEDLKLIRSDKAVAAAVMTAIREASKNLFLDEEVLTSFAYPEAYRARFQTPIKLEKQVEELAGLYRLATVSGKVFDLARRLDMAHPHPGGIIDGWKASFAWWTRWEKYQCVIEEIFAILAESRSFSFKNWIEGKLDEEHLRQAERTLWCERRLWETQGEQEFFFHPFQLGLRHAGQSVRRARAIFDRDEFGLSVLECVEALFLYPEREQVCGQLHIDCAGDEYSLDADGQFVGTPYFEWGDYGLYFFTSWPGRTSKRFGSASGFLLQELLALSP